MKRKIMFLLCLLIGSITFNMFTITVNADNGPASNGYVSFVERPGDEDIYVYHAGVTNNSALTGASYEKDTNTLTIKDVKGKYELNVYRMGEDFKLNVLGTNDFLHIFVDSEIYETYVTFTGNGTLILNKDRDMEYPVPILANYNGKLIFEDTVSLFLYSGDRDPDEGNYPDAVIGSDVIFSSDPSSSIIFKGNDKPEVKALKYDDSDYRLRIKSFALIPESIMSFNVAVKDNKKYAYLVDGEGKITIYDTELVLDTYSNKIYITNTDIDDSTTHKYDSSLLAEEDGYDLANHLSEKASLGYVDRFDISEDSNGKRYAVIDDDNLVFDITEDIITIDDSKYIYLVLNTTVDYNSLTDVKNYYAHYVPGKELVIDRNKKSNNPKTSDNIINYIVITIISSLGLIFIYKKEI